MPNAFRQPLSYVFILTLVSVGDLRALPLSEVVVSGAKQALHDPDPAVVVRALAFLAKDEQRKPAITEMLVKEYPSLSGLADPGKTGPEARANFYRALGDYPQAVGAFEKELLRDALVDDGARLAAARALRTGGRALSDETRKRVAEMLLSDDANVRNVASSAIPHWGEAGAVTLDTLGTVLESSIPDRVLEALAVLDGLKHVGAPLAVRVLSLMTNADSRVRGKALVAYLSVHVVPPTQQEIDAIVARLGALPESPQRALIACALVALDPVKNRDANFISSCLNQQHLEVATATLDSLALANGVPLSAVQELLRNAKSGDIALHAMQVLVSQDAMDADTLGYMLTKYASWCDSVWQLSRNAIEKAQRQNVRLASIVASVTLEENCDAWLLSPALDVVASPDVALTIFKPLFEKEVTARMVEVLRVAPKTRRATVPLLLKALGSSEETTRERAASILVSGAALNEEQVRQIAELIKDPTDCCAAMHVLGHQGPSAHAYAHLLDPYLAEPDGDWATPALEALANMRTLGTSEPRVISFLKGADTGNAQRAITTLRVFPDALGRNKDLVARWLADEALGLQAVATLAVLGVGARPYADAFIDFLKPNNTQEARDVATNALVLAAPLDDKDTVRLLGFALDDAQRASEYRFLAYVTSPGGGEIPLARLAAHPNSATRPATPMPKAALATIHRAWDCTREAPAVRRALSDAIINVIMGNTWELAELDVLERATKLLSSVGADTSEVTSRLWTMRAAVYGRGIVGGLFLHLLAWIVLLLFYPTSVRLQAMFFWSETPRRLLGLAYVDWLILYLPPIQRRLFKPFGQRLTEDLQHGGSAGGKESDNSYFPGSDVELVKSTATGSKTTTESVLEAIPRLDGQIVLEGDSGLGKSMFIRHLIRSSDRPTVYLRAEDCANGVLQAIQRKLGGLASEEKLLKSLVYVGALDICIDGANEVNADTRAHIKEFMRSHPHARILVATQPIANWNPPGRVLRLLPLSEANILKFLHSREVGLPPYAVIRGEAYKEACGVFLTQAMSDTHPVELLRASRQILSNPMDLTTVATIVADKRVPNLLCLQEQQYQLMSGRLTRKGHAFRLAEFSRHVYEARLSDRSELDAAAFYPELTAMVEAKMVLKRYASSDPDKPTYGFRHDKVMEFFLLQAFLASEMLPENHLDDPRFRGVYFLMAMQMPLEAAVLLREQLVLHAAEKQDHSVSDRFIQLLESRKRAAGVPPVWAGRYRSPAVQVLSQKLESLRTQQAAFSESVAAMEGRLALLNASVFILTEPHEGSMARRLALLLKDLFAPLPGVAVATTGRTVRLDLPDRTALRWLVVARAGAVAADDIFEAAAEAAPSTSAKILLIINANHGMEPAVRVWFTRDAEDAARAKGLCVLTTETFLVDLAGLHGNRFTDAQWLEHLRGAIGVTGPFTVRPGGEP